MKSKEVSECKGYLKIEVVNNSQLLSSLNGDEKFMKSYLNSYSFTMALYNTTAKPMRLVYENLRDS